MPPKIDKEDTFKRELNNLMSDHIHEEGFTYQELSFLAVNEISSHLFNKDGIEALGILKAAIDDARLIDLEFNFFNCGLGLPQFYGKNVKEVPIENELIVRKNLHDLLVD